MSSHKAQLEVGARSETGYVRNENQDRMSGTRVPLGQLYIVADGMGGHKGGALAAELTVQGLQRHIGEAPADAAVEKVLQAAFQKVNADVYRRAHSGNPATEGMGSTAVLLLIAGRDARLASVGDSRAYLYRNGRLRQLTTDHTVVQKMVQTGILKPEEAIDHPNASVLERAIGSKQSVEVDISGTLPLKEGDGILLCSDGLSSYVTAPEIAAVLRSRATVQEIPERLVKLALQKGGEDNVTVQFIQYSTRKEAQLTSSKLLRRFLQRIVPFVLGVAVSAVGFFGYLHIQKSKSALRIEELERQLEAGTPARKDAEDEVKALKKQSATTEQYPTKKVDKVQEKVKAGTPARKDAEDEVKALKKQSATTEQKVRPLEEKLKADEEQTKPKATRKPEVTTASDGTAPAPNTGSDEP